MPPLGRPTQDKEAAAAALGIEIIIKYDGNETVQRMVKVLVPGKFFNNLTPSEAAKQYEGQAAEFIEMRKFEQHKKGWGAAHKGPGIRFVCISDAVDDPDHKGFWTTLSLWNRWRHETYKDNRLKLGCCPRSFGRVSASKLGG